MNLEPIRQRLMADAREDQELVGVLRGVGLVGEEFKGLSKVAFSAERPNQPVVVGIVFCRSRFQGRRRSWRFGRVTRRVVVEAGGDGGGKFGGGLGSGENPHHIRLANKTALSSSLHKSCTISICMYSAR